MIREALKGKRIFVTGATGFLGTNVVERLMRSVPDCDLVLLVRPGRRSSVAARVKREILRNDVFDRMRAELGDERFAEEAARRITAVAGDVGRDGLGLDEHGRELLAGCHTVIHSAASVSFDSPLDSAVEVNLLGPTRIVSLLQELGATPHLVAVSTCYVAGSRRGAAPEQLIDDSPFFVDVDWRAEVDAARKARRDAEAESRSPAQLTRLRREARQELGAAGGPLLADKTEQLRSRWVAERMVTAGRARAAALGWPDAYAYTKALGERALAETRGDIPVDIVRPSIIESAMAEPRPGWIRGFRMAEPVIISYARGLLKQFPGVPEGIIDVIPVDLVTAAIIAVAARGPAGTAAEAQAGAAGEVTPGSAKPAPTRTVESGQRGIAKPAPATPAEPSQRDMVRVTQVASGSTNPLRYKRLVDLVREWFSEHPIYDPDGQPIMVPEWSFPGRGQVQGQLNRAKKLLGTAEAALGKLPLRGRRADWGADVEAKREEVERALSYVELYGAYAECEAIYDVSRLLELWDRQSPEDKRDFCFDPRVVDWDRYVTDTHLPSVVEHARVRTAPPERAAAGGRSTPDRATRLRRQVLSPERQLVAFDLENTLVATNVVATYAWLATRRLSGRDRLKLLARTIAEAPGLMAVDRKDRSDFLRSFYRLYDGAPVAQLREDSTEMLSALILRRSFPAAIRRVREHRELGHRTVLVTSALDFVVEPLRPLFHDIICPRLSQATSPGGRRTYTGELTQVPPAGESQAQALIDYADAQGLDMRESVAYADSTSDLPMLEIVGFPVAVNPTTRLAALARKRGWLVENFEESRVRAPGLSPASAWAPSAPLQSSERS